MAEHRSTVLGYAAVGELPNDIRYRGPLLAAEGLAFTAVAVCVSHYISPAQGGIFALFLTAAALRSRLGDLLEENRKRIWELKLPSGKTNALTAASAFAIFVGVIAGFIIAGAITGWASERGSFQFALDAAGLGGDTILTRQFGNFGALLAHNFLVLFAVLVLAFLYRAYGALLAFIWNACVWGLVLTELVRRGIAATDTSTAAFIAVSSCAVLPHLACEAASYVIGALAGIYFSKGLLNYGFGHERFKPVLRVCGKLVVIAAVSLLLAGLFESQLTPRLLSTLK